MKVERSLLEENLYKYFGAILDNKEKKSSLVKYVQTTYDYPEIRILDYMMKRRTLTEATDFDLFVILDGVAKVWKDKKGTSYYFTDTEIKHYSQEKFKQRKRISFPLSFNMIEITDDQWIGRISAKELVELRNAGIIRYNENIQRTMKKGMRGKTEEYRITENKKATKEIRELMEADNFISNTITLNIPDDGTSEFSYLDGVLIIKKVNSLDIIDGFHRLIALEQASNLNRKFDYPMELRITNYSEAKGQRFVYQEDQKTKMTKTDSNSFNVDDDANKAVQRLNEDVNCPLQGQIKRNKGLIVFGEMAAVIKKLYFTGLKKDESRQMGFQLPKMLSEDFATLVNHNTKWMTESYSFMMIAIILTCFKWLREHNIDRGKWGDVIEYVINHNTEKKRFRLKALTMPTINYINSLCEEGEGNV